LIRAWSSRFRGTFLAFRVISQGPACIQVLQTGTARGQWATQNEDSATRTRPLNKDKDRTRMERNKFEYNKAMDSAGQEDLKRVVMAKSKPKSPGKATSNRIVL